MVQLNLASKSLQVTNTNGFAGNNGRASVLVNGQYYIIGNAGNSGSTPSPTYGIVDMLTMDTGVQTIAAGSTLYAITSTVGDTIANVDEGVDPNQLVKITVNVNGSTVTPTGSGFSVMETAPYGQVLRGVALVPTTSLSSN